MKDETINAIISEILLKERMKGYEQGKKDILEGLEIKIKKNLTLFPHNSDYNEGLQDIVCMIKELKNLCKN